MKLMLLLGIISALFGCSSTAKPVENDTITRFSLSSGGGMNRFSGYSYMVKETHEGKVHFIFNEGYPDEKEFTLDDHAVFDSLQLILQKYKMYKYHGYYKPLFDVLDGHSWHLDVDYASGKEIEASGYMAGPDNYGEAFREVRRCLDQWKNLPVANNDVVKFLYEYGSDRYCIERKDDHAVVTYDNQKTGEHQVIEKSLDLLENLRVFINIERFKMNKTRGELDFEHTPWMYEINYANGDHYRYESYDRDYKCGYTEALQSFISYCMSEQENNPFYYY